jgi:hypothetical protein
VNEFSRLFGDANGNRVVNGLDTYSLRTAYNSTSSSPNYLWFFDYNMDRTINSLDAQQYQKNLGRRPLA